MAISEAHEEEINDAFRAIGRYTYCFSRLVFWMRAELEDAVGTQHLAQIVTAEMTAYPIQGAFFGVCAERYEPNESDQKIAKMLRKQVTAAIKFRNSVAHGDWLIGAHDGHGSNVHPPILSRVRPSSNSGSQWNSEILTPADLDRKSDDLEELRRNVHLYGATAGGLIFVGHGHRPSDVFSIRDGIVVRDGRVKFESYIIS